jgi:hypothetical protein
VVLGRGGRTFAFGGEVDGGFLVYHQFSTTLTTPPSPFSRIQSTVRTANDASPGYVSALTYVALG